MKYLELSLQIIRYMIKIKKQASAKAGAFIMHERRKQIGKRNTNRTISN